MPRVVLRGPNGDQRSIDTVNYRTLADWLGEWVPQLSSPNSFYYSTIEVWPSFDFHGTMESGWTAQEFRTYQLNQSEDVDRLLNDLHEALGRVRAIPDQSDCSDQ